MERRLHKGDDHQLSALFRLLPAHAAAATVSQRAVWRNQRHDRHCAERLHRGSSSGASVLRLCGRQLCTQEGAHGVSHRFLCVLCRLHRSRHNSHVCHLPNAPRRTLRGGDGGQQHMRHRRAASLAKERGHRAVWVKQQFCHGHSPVGGNMAARCGGQLHGALLDCPRGGRLFRGHCRHTETAGKGDHKKQRQAVARPLLPDTRVAAGYKHCHVWLLLGRAQQLSSHLQQGSTGHYGRHRHLFRHSILRSVPLAPARTQGAARRPTDTERHGGHVSVARRLHLVRGSAPSRGLLSVGSTHRSGQRPSLSCLPQHVCGGGTP